MDKKKLFVTFILDESSSMQSMKQEAIELFNSQLKEIEDQAKTLDIKVSLVTFSTFPKIDDKRWVQNAGNFLELTNDTYLPNGLTSLYDAVGFSIDKLIAMPDFKDEDYSLFIIVTDGEENCSKTYRGAALSEKIKELSDKNWTFSILGTNLNLEKLAESLKVNVANTQSFANTSSGYRTAGASLKQGFTSYCASIVDEKTGGDFFSEESKTTSNPVKDISNTILNQ